MSYTQSDIMGLLGALGTKLGSTWDSGLIHDRGYTFGAIPANHAMRAFISYIGSQDVGLKGRLQLSLVAAYRVTLPDQESCEMQYAGEYPWVPDHVHITYPLEEGYRNIAFNPPNRLFDIVNEAREGKLSGHAQEADGTDAELMFRAYQERSKAGGLLSMATAEPNNSPSLPHREFSVTLDATDQQLEYTLGTWLDIVDHYTNLSPFGYRAMFSQLRKAAGDYTSWEK